MLDFVGHHRKEFRFDRRFRALLGGSRKDLAAADRAGLPVPPGGLPHGARPGRAARSSSTTSARPCPRAGPPRSRSSGRLARDGASVTLASFLRSRARRSRTSTRARSLVGPARGRGSQRVRPRARTRRRCGARAAGCSTSTIAVRIDAYRRLLASTDAARCSVACRARAPALCGCSSRRSPTGRLTKATTLAGGVRLLWSHPQVRASCWSSSMCSTARRRPRARTLCHRHPDVPLQVHARYTRIEILAAFGIGDAREGRALADRRLLGEAGRRPTCSRSRSTRPAASSRRRRATATTRSAAT